MKSCNVLVVYALPLSIALAANLRSNPGTIATNAGKIATTAGWGAKQNVGLAKNTVPAAAATASSEHVAKKMLQTHRLTLQNYKGVQYTAPVTFGAQKLMAVYDTGSFEIMGMSNMCTVCKIPPPLIKYNNKSSNTFKAGTGPVEDHHFAGGLVQARQDFETVHVGDFGDSFSVPKMPFWQVVSTNMKVWMSNRAQFTAIVGLGHREQLPGNQQPNMPANTDSLIERTGTERFAVCLQKGVSSPGYITFNPQFALPPPQPTTALGAGASTSMFHRVPVIGKNHWAVKLDGVSTSGSYSGERCVGAHKCVAIVDSGTSLLGIPPSAVSFIIPLMKAIKADCSNLHQLQDLVFNIAGQQFVMPSSAYVIQFRANPGMPRKCLPAFTDFAMTSPQGAVWILGMPFLRHFFTVFDRVEPAVFIAAQGPNCQPAAMTNNTAFVNKTGFAVESQEPAFADVSEATLPSWANGKTSIDI